MKRAAKIYAHAVVVGCPHCNEPLPDLQHGSFIWTPEQLREANGTKVVCSCGNTFIIQAGKTARLD